MRYLEEANSLRESRIEVTRRQEEGEGGIYCLMGTEYTLGMMKKF